jgi:hypothetical protein
MKPQVQLLEGRRHLVVPMVMAVEGVISGSNGPLLYTQEDLRRSAISWNGRPVVVYHPDISAASHGRAGHPEVFNRQRVGTVFDARFDEKSKALKANAWLDEERLRAVDPRVLRAVQNGTMVEVSTGLHVDQEERPGVFRGRAYDAIARNYRPDHLAILPDQVGACSIADGAGLCRNQIWLGEEPLVAPSLMAAMASVA